MMTIPDYQTLMRPILEAASDGGAHRTVDLVEVLANRFHLSSEDCDQTLASGQRTIFNRCHWAVTYLAKARLLDRVSRGQVAITDRGREALATSADRIDAKFLSRYPEFQEFRARTAAPLGEGTESATESVQTPEELLESTYAALRRSVEADLLDRVLAASPEFFEQLVVDLLRKMGYGGSHADASRRVGQTGDDGIDGVIDEDRLGLDAVYIQAKRWQPARPVRRPDLQAFAGSLEGQRASKGVFITTSRFTDDAREYITRISRRIVLIDGQTLARLMFEHEVGVREYRHFDVRRVDGAYFEGDV